MKTYRGIKKNYSEHELEIYRLVSSGECTIEHVAKRSGLSCQRVENTVKNIGRKAEMEARNELIYKLVHEDGVEQENVAERFGISVLAVRHLLWQVSVKKRLTQEEIEEVVKSGTEEEFLEEGMNKEKEIYQGCLECSVFKECENPQNEATCPTDFVCLDSPSGHKQLNEYLKKKRDDIPQFKFVERPPSELERRIEAGI